MKKIIMTILIVIALLYGVVGFVTLRWNIFEWTMEVRGVFLGISIIIAFLILIFSEEN